MHAGVGDDVFEPFQLSDDKCAVGPWAGVRDVKMIAVFLGGELGVWVCGDPITEDGLLAFELAGFVAGLDPVGDGIFLVLGRGLSWGPIGICVG